MSGKIVKATVGPYPQGMFDPMPEVRVWTEGDDLDGDGTVLFSFYPDEIDFRPDEFEGLTVQQAHQLRHGRDVRYLRS